jgi:hypothetical protein
MFVVAAEHPVLTALAVLVVGWLAWFLHKGFAVRKTFHDQVCRVLRVVCIGAGS